jgi:hypothetical protein
MTNIAARETEQAVLDSIRRLLTDGHPAERRPMAAPVTGSEKLLLTPALRVGENAPESPQPHVAPAAWSLEERIAELEAAVGDRPDEWEPDGSEDADQERPNRFVFQHRSAQAAAPSVEPLRPVEPAAPQPLARRAEEDDGEEDEGFDIFADDRLPDPDALRDLVAEIVRQELQSDLGQRVTRNIRKLVRREIRRALAARDFD